MDFILVPPASTTLHETYTLSRKVFIGIVYAKKME